MIRIIQQDNFGRGGEQPGYDDRIVLHLRCWETAVTIANLLNEDDNRPDQPYYYKAVKEDFKLNKFEA